MQEKINQIYASSKTYPELVGKLIDIGVQSYTVDVATSIVLYRFANGETIIRSHGTENRMVSVPFRNELTVQAIRHNQQGKNDYPAFMNDIAEAGVRFYEATFRP
jgi:uncharacterized protein YbcV (DUF1398 family)